MISLGFITCRKTSDESDGYLMKPIICKMFQNEERSGAKADAILFIRILEELFHPNFDDVAQKILFITSDNCTEANLLRRTVIEILDRRYPLMSGLPREAIRCGGHVFANSEVCFLSDNSKLRDTAELITQIFGRSSTNLSEIWVNRVGERIKPIKGIRWHSRFHNMDVAIRNLNSLKSILEEFRTFKGAKTLLENLEDDKLIQDLISASLAGTFLGAKWPQVTKK